MKLFSASLPVVFCLSTLLVSGCSGETLNGGSNASSSSSGSSGAGASSGADTSGPLAGQIGGKPFTPLGTNLQFDNTNKQWFLSFTNYKDDCGTVDGPDTGVAAEDRVVVTIGGITAAAGSYPIAYGDGHGATFQIGVYTATGPKPQTSSPAGTLVFRDWTDTVGASVNGSLDLTSNNGDSVKGTFTVKVCAPR